MHAPVLSRLAALLLVATTVTGCTVSLKPRSAECTLGAIVSAGGGCAPLPRTADAADDEAKQFLPTSGKANLYVVRPSIVGGRYLWRMEVDGQFVGQIAEHTYLLLELAPGAHEVTVVTGENRHSAVVQAGAGENHVLEVVSKMGWTESRAELRPLTLEDGKAAVRDARRVERAR